jgi:hypothetical protein
MREIRTSGSMSGDGKRSHRYEYSFLSMTTAPILDSTVFAVHLSPGMILYAYY